MNEWLWVPASHRPNYRWPENAWWTWLNIDILCQLRTWTRDQEFVLQDDQHCCLHASFAVMCRELLYVFCPWFSWCLNLNSYQFGCEIIRQSQRACAFPRGCQNQPELNWREHGWKSKGWLGKPSPLTQCPRLEYPFSPWTVVWILPSLRANVGDTLLIHWTHTGVSRVPGAHLSGDQAVVLGLYALATLTQFRTRLLEKSSVPKGPGETLHFGRCDYQMDVKLHCAWHL